MSERIEPKKETVRIAVTPPPEAKPAGSRDTVRITLPTRPPQSAPLPPTNAPAAGTVRLPVAKPLIPPAPSKAVQPPRFIPPPAPPQGKPTPSMSPSAASAAASVSPASPGPKKETARITVLPDPPPASGVQMKKTQPLFDMPVATAPSVSPVTVASEPVESESSLPMALCWGLVGLSAAVLIIQILNYIS